MINKLIIFFFVFVLQVRVYVAVGLRLLLYIRSHLTHDVAPYTDVILLLILYGLRRLLSILFSVEYYSVGQM